MFTHLHEIMIWRLSCVRYVNMHNDVNVSDDRKGIWSSSQWSINDGRKFLTTAEDLNIVLEYYQNVVGKLSYVEQETFL